MGHLIWSCMSVNSNILELLASEDDYALYLVQYLCARMEWRGCTNILFTQGEPLDMRVNIIINYSLIYIV
jgi:hypothetical protein